MATTSTNAESIRPAAPRAIAHQSGFIVGPLYDLAFFILSPLLALLLGVIISGNEFAQRPFMLGGYTNSAANMFIGSFIMAHLVIVFFRSHANQAIFSKYPLRFTVVPLVLFLAMNFSMWIAVVVSVVATWWDVYHSSLQTFGIGRIYDAKAGNDPHAGRQLDRWFNLLLYAGPILAGATLMDHVNDFHEFERVDSVFFSSIPVLVESNRHILTWGVLGLGIPFLCAYLLAYWRLSQKGYKVSYQKIALLFSTGVVSIYTWGFNSFGEAFFIMNFFHAWQYFALVWWSENKNLAGKLHVGRRRWGLPLVFAIFLGSAFGYGFWAETMDDKSSIFFNLVIVVAIMHFWYDGFIWSVRKKQI